MFLNPLIFFYLSFTHLNFHYLLPFLSTTCHLLPSTSLISTDFQIGIPILDILVSGLRVEKQIMKVKTLSSK